MPNHCYAHITVSEKYSKKLEEIAKVGLCRYYRPMPEELVNTSSPARVVTQGEYDKQMEKNKTDDFKSYPLTIDRQKMLLDLYGVDNWYDWAHKNGRTDLPQPGGQLMIVSSSFYRKIYQVLAILLKRNKGGVQSLRWKMER